MYILPKTVSLSEKLIAILVMTPLVFIGHTQFALANTNIIGANQAEMVFEINQGTLKQNVQVSTSDIEEVKETNTNKNNPDELYKKKYAELLKNYLESKKSPLAQCAEVLVDLKNEEKILSLANAESGLGKRFPKSTYNMWGVGGSKLWKMGDNYCSAIVKMDEFLSNHPKRSSVKYSEMSIERMNGLYKQPPGDHWVRNNNVIINTLQNLKADARNYTNTQLALK